MVANPFICLCLYVCKSTGKINAPLVLPFIKRKVRFKKVRFFNRWLIARMIGVAYSHLLRNMLCMMFCVYLIKLYNWLPENNSSCSGIFRHTFIYNLRSIDNLTVHMYDLRTDIDLNCPRMVQRLQTIRQENNVSHFATNR